MFSAKQNLVKNLLIPRSLSNIKPRHDVSCFISRWMLVCVWTLEFYQMFQSGYNLPRFWEVTWVQTYSTVLGRNITEVEPTNLRQHQVYIEVGLGILSQRIISKWVYIRFTSTGFTWYFSIWLPSLSWQFSTYVSTGRTDYYLPNIIMIKINLNLQNAILFNSNCPGKWERQHLFVQIFQGNFFYPKVESSIF